MNSTKSIFQLDPSCIINWIDFEEEFLRIAKGCHNYDDGSIKRLEVELVLEYIEMIEQQAAYAPTCSSMVLQLALQLALESLQSALPMMLQPVDSDITVSFVIPASSVIPETSFIKVS